MKSEQPTTKKERKLMNGCEKIFHKLSQLINEIDEMDKKIEMMEQCATARTARSQGKQSLNAFIGMHSYEK
ncbi:unnamed protein product, partial [Mesorhabditis belari]|uniref:Uncharacterized protein n=1 Tax=Mesorhabditis belari TaxID=2138241 RepID=A0AAF3EA82_9BILA